MLRSARSDRGTTAIEMVVILPVLLLFLFAVMEGARIFGIWVILTNEAREAARYGAINDFNASGSFDVAAWKSNVTTYAITNVGQMLNTTPLAVNPQPQLSGLTPLASSVTLSYTVTTVTPLIQAVLPQVTVTTTAVMRAE